MKYCPLILLLLLSSCVFTSGGSSRVDRKNLSDSIKTQEKVTNIITATKANTVQLDILDNEAVITNNRVVASASDILRSNNEYIGENASTALDKAVDIENRSDGYIDFHKIGLWVLVCISVIVLGKFGLLPIVIWAFKSVIVSLGKFILDFLEDNTVHNITKKSNKE